MFIINLGTSSIWQYDVDIVHNVFRLLQLLLVLDVFYFCSYLLVLGVIGRVRRRGGVLLPLEREREREREAHRDETLARRGQAVSRRCLPGGCWCMGLENNKFLFVWGAVGRAMPRPAPRGRNNHTSIEKGLAATLLSRSYSWRRQSNPHPERFTLHTLGSLSRPNYVSTRWTVSTL